MKLLALFIFGVSSVATASPRITVTAISGYTRAEDRFHYVCEIDQNRTVKLTKYDHRTDPAGVSTKEYKIRILKALRLNRLIQQTKNGPIEMGPTVCDAGDYQVSVADSLNGPMRDVFLFPNCGAQMRNKAKATQALVALAVSTCRLKDYFIEF